MGKSTILTALSNKIQNTHLKWKVRIDLNKYTKYFLELKEKLLREKDDYNDLGKYAMDKIYGRIPPNEEEKPFEFRVFDEMFRQNKVLLIFDGFDEISPVYENLMLSILEKMKNNTQNHLWITSRLNMKHTLERKLKTISFTIMPFTEDDQNEFLKKFWRSNWKTKWSQNHERHLKHYAKILVSEFNEMTKRNDTDIIGIPLQTKMLGDVFQENDKADRDWQSCYTFLKRALKCDPKSCRCSPSLRNKLQNLYILYEAFVKIHITRYLKEKNDFDSSKVGWSLTDALFYNEAHKAHKILGMFALLNDNELKKLITREEYEIKNLWMQQIQTGNASFGLISYVSTDGKPFFTHLTFAEFFAAKYLNEKLIFSPYQVFELMDIILQQDVPVFHYCVKYLMRTDICTKDLEKALGNTTVVNFVSKHGFVNCFNSFTLDDDFEYDFPQIDNLGRSPMHYAAEFNHIKSVIFILLQKYNRLSKSDTKGVFFKNREFREIDDEDKCLISIERKTRLFLLQDFITLADINGKTALDYSFDPQINDILNDFIKIGKNNLIPYQGIKALLSDIQWIKSKYDFIKELNNNEPIVLMKDVIYLCSLKTLSAIIDNCDIKEGILSSSKNSDFFDSIFSRENICESERIIFFQNLLAKHSPSDLRREIVAAILHTSIIYNNREVFEHFFQEENIHQLPEEFNICYASAAEANNFKIINFLFKNMGKNLTLDFSDFLHPVKTEVIVLERIFEQFKGNAESEQRYAERILLKELADTYHRLSISKIKFLLSKQPGIYLTDDHGKTAWDYAISPYSDDHLEILEFLVPCISDPKIRNIAQKYYECKNSDRVYNCLEAFEQDDEMFCLFLIRNCRSVNMKDEGGKTPLFYACEKGWRNAVKLLLEMGACYEDIFDENGELFDCCINNNDIAKLLQEVKLHFSNLTFSSIANYPKVFWGTVNIEQKPLWYIVASKGGTSDILSKPYKLFSHYSGKFRDSEGNTLLHLAAKCGIIEIVEELLRGGECYEAKNNSNQTPADLAKSNGVRIIFKELDKLFKAVKSHEEIFNENFHPKRGDVFFSATDIYGKSLLHYAVINGFYFKKVFVIMKDVINLRDIDNKTPLHYAIERNDAKMVKLLLQSEAKLGKKNYYDNIEDNECKYVIEILNQLFTDIDNHDINGFMEKIDTLNFSPVSDFKIDEILNVKNETGKNMFEHALNLNDYDLTIFLLIKGVEIYDADDCKNPKIIRLISFINKIFNYVESDVFETSSIIRLIEENNLTEIIPKVKVLCKDTLLHKSVEENNPEMVEWLIRNGADVSAQNSLAKTALDLARENDFVYIIELLTRPKQRNSRNTIMMNKNKFNSKNEILSFQSYPTSNKITQILKNLDFQQPFGDEIKKSNGTIINRHGFRDKKDWIKFWKNGTNIKLDTLLDIVNVVDILTINIISKKKIPFVAYFNPEWWQGINPLNKTSIYSEEELIGFYGVNLSQTTKFIFFPLLINFHWITFVYDVDKNKLSCYNPIYKNYFQEHWKNYYKTATFFIEKFIFIIYGKSIDVKKKKNLTQDFRQKDEVSSGLFISKYMEVVMDGGIFPTNFNINEYRTEIIELFNQITGKSEEITTSNLK